MMSMESMLFSPGDRMMSLLCVCEERDGKREILDYLGGDCVSDILSNVKDNNGGGGRRD